jgi:hypothetical protein
VVKSALIAICFLHFGQLICLAMPSLDRPQHRKRLVGRFVPQHLPASEPVLPDASNVSPAMRAVAGNCRPVDEQLMRFRNVADLPREAQADENMNGFLELLSFTARSAIRL